MFDKEVYMKEYNKQYYQKRKEEIKQRASSGISAIRKRVADYKLARGCEICGYNKSARALHFHHLDPETKSTQIAIMVSSQYSWERIMEEIEKCILVCANCHAELHDAENEPVAE